MVHLDGREGSHTFDLNAEQRASLLRRTHETYKDAVRQRQVAVIHPNDLGLLLHGYDHLHHRLLSDATTQVAPVVNPAAVQQSTPTPTPAGHHTINPLVRAVRAAVMRDHTAGCEACREILQQVRDETAEAAGLVVENERLRRTAAEAQALAHRMTVERDALICERDEALWKLRDAEVAERHRRSLPEGDR